MSLGDGGGAPPALPAARPIPIELDARQAQKDIQKRLAQAKGRRASTAAGYLQTPPIVSNLALADTLGGV